MHFIFKYLITYNILIYLSLYISKDYFCFWFKNPTSRDFDEKTQHAPPKIAGSQRARAR